MFNESNTVMITKPIEEVFAYVNNLANMPEWQGGIEKVSYTQNPAELGTRFTQERSFLGRHVKISLKITAFEQNVGYTARALDGPLNMDIRVSLEAVEGGTEMTTRVKGEAKGFARMAEGMIAAQMGLSLREDGERLKGILESTTDG